MDFGIVSMGELNKYRSFSELLIDSLELNRIKWVRYGGYVKLDELK